MKPNLLSFTICSDGTCHVRKNQQLFIQDLLQWWFHQLPSLLWNELYYAQYKRWQKSQGEAGKTQNRKWQRGKNALAEIGGCGHEQLAIESFLSCILFQVYLEFAAKGAWVVGAPWHSVSVDESVNLQKKVGDASTSAWSLWWRNLGRSDLSGPLHTCACGKHNMNPATFRLTAQRV